MRPLYLISYFIYLCTYIYFILNFILNYFVSLRDILLDVTTFEMQGETIFDVQSA